MPRYDLKAKLSRSFSRYFDTLSITIRAQRCSTHKNQLKACPPAKMILRHVR